MKTGKTAFANLVKKARNPLRPRLGQSLKIMAAAPAIALVALAAAAPANASATHARPAYSSYVYDHYYGGTNLRTCGNTGCGSIAYMPQYTGVTMLCWEDTQWVYPPNSNYATPRWFEVTTPYGVGFVHSSFVYNQTGVGHC